jgi:predicted acylesterase/phospholipase RssA
MEQVPNFQRVLVLQGGGSLGAYEAGAYQAMYEMITKQDKERGNKGKPLLDIVAGTSIGAINSTVLVSYVKENNTWEGSSERLNEFWEYLSKESSLDRIPGFTDWWDFLHSTINRNIATGEAARRYYTTKEFSVIGVPTVFSPLIPQLYTKFFDPLNL